MLDLKDKCREDGRKVRVEWVARYHGETFSGEDEYAYNAELNTCLWTEEYWGPAALLGGQIRVKFILDVQGNKTLIEFTEHNGKQLGGCFSGDV